jgi:diaminopimelate decarboxylase
VSFHYQDAHLACDGVSLSEIGERVGTPFYVYSARTLRESYAAVDTAFGDYPHDIHYALKANSTIGLVRVLRSLGSHVDANSGGEIEVALRAGFIPPQIVFTGVGKTNDELERAVELGVKTINIESAGEAARIAGIAAAQGTRARVALRINPDIDPKSHPHISTGQKSAKFGVPIEHARALYRDMAACAGLEPVGVHVHLGSQMVDLEPVRRAVAIVTALAEDITRDGIPLEHLDAGGGLGVSYDGRAVPGPSDYAAAILPAVRSSGLRLLLEPGRAIVAAAGALVGRIVDLKQYEGGRRFVVLDTGMSELMRPALYDAFHRVVPVERRAGDEQITDVVGPICETSDTLAKGRPFPPAAVGDFVAVLDAGAYGSVMSSNYNRRMLPAEVLVDEGRWRVIRRRQSLEDVLALEE